MAKIRIVLKFVKQKRHEETMSTAYLLLHIYLVAFMFVDDTDFFTLGRPT